MKKLTLAGIFALLLLLSATAVHGHAVMTSRPITVVEARALPHDSWVILTGTIVNALPGGKNFTFRDPSGDITVEIDRNVWRGLSVGVSDRVDIYGELRINRGLVSVRVRAISTGSSAPVRQGQAITVSRPIAISEARSLSHDSWVVLAGNIVNSFPGSDNYTFRDPSGEIIVEISSNVWRGLYVGVSDEVEIHGEVRIDRGIVTITARAIRKT